MPSFTLPIGTEVTATSLDGEQESTILPETFTVSWEENKAERDKKKKQMKQPYEPVNLNLMPNFPVDLLDKVYYLDTLQSSVPQPCNPVKTVSNNKEHNMSNNIYAASVSTLGNVPTDQKQRDYTLGRLRDIKDQKYIELRTQFGLEDDRQPDTFEDLMARIQAGKFIFPEDKKQKHYGIWSILDIIRWRDPSVKEDQDGFNKATEKLDEAYTTARDQTVLDVPTQGLKIIEEFKSATFH